MGKSDAPGTLGKGTGECGIVPSVQSCPGQPGVPSRTAWRWWAKDLGEISPGARWVQGPPPCVGLGAGTPTTLRLSCLYARPFSLDPALGGVWTQKKKTPPLLTFPTCNSSRSPGGMSRSLLHLPRDQQSHCSPTWGNPGAPQTCRAVSCVQAAAHCACRGQGGSVCLPGKPQETVNTDTPPQLQQLHLEELHPNPGLGGHKPASISAAPGGLPPPIFLPPARSGRRTLRISGSIALAAPPPSPARSPSFPHSLPRGEQHPTPRGGTYLHALCVFLSERRGGR